MYLHHSVTIKTVAYITKSIVLPDDDHHAPKMIDWPEEEELADGGSVHFALDEAWEVVDHDCWEADASEIPSGEYDNDGDD
jgi:hypothetical protein